MGLPLPEELVGLTFSHLDIPSLLRCMQVCKLFHAIISGNTLLGYKIELFASNMEDNELSPTDLVTRFNLLREHNRVWNHLDFPSSGSIPMLDSYWEFSGGIFAQANTQNQVFFVQLPCKLKGIEERKWSVPFDFQIRDFTFDNSQDLIALVQVVGTVPNVSCNVHFRTLSGKDHPRTAMPQITHEMGDLRAHLTFLMQICGDHFGMLFSDQLDTVSQNFFAVWNWRTGQREVYIRLPSFRSFAFMTEDLILTGISKSDTEPTLRVLSIAACVNPIHSLEDMPYICELQYPQLLERTEFFLIRSEPTPTWKPPLGSGIPFYHSRRDSIFTVAMRHTSDSAHESTVLFVPLSTLLKEVERSRDVPCRNVIWRDWGPSGTRMVCRGPSDTWVCYTYGTKFVHGLRWEGRRTARVYDFNRYATRRHVKRSTDSPIPWKPLVAASEPSGQCEIFEEEVVTSLPGRVANFKLGASRGEGWEAVMIGEDHILMVQGASDQYGYMAM